MEIEINLDTVYQGTHETELNTKVEELTQDCGTETVNKFLNRSRH